MRLEDWFKNPLGEIAKLYRRPLPQVRGRMRLGGLYAPVEVLRDQLGVPHIYARRVEDAMFAHGFVHAQDRFWQMELNRRVGRGRLAELFGEIALGTDQLIRTIGLPRAAEKSLAATPPEIRALLDAYARGVNECLSLGKRPLELTLLRHEPEPWQPLDSLAWAQMMAFTLSANWDTELLHAALVAKLGPERAARLRGELPSENPIVVPDHTWSALYEDAVSRMKAASELMPLAFGGASNNWVVDGKKSTTGRPLLANDPHLALQMPSIWYETHLVCPELEAAGVSLPGAPGIVLGHNARIAWGMTAAMSDVVDLFVVKRDEIKDAQVIREQVRVKGKDPVTFEIVVTRHGPLVAGLGPRPVDGGHALAMKWTAADGNRVHEAIFGLNRARNWDDFRAACAKWDAPGMNVVYADVDGHIGYQLVGKVPVRKRGEGFLPAPGDGSHDCAPAPFRTKRCRTRAIPSATTSRRRTTASPVASRSIFSATTT
jgi:penicillin amidase